MLVLDANILIRAVLGLRVRTLLASYGTVVFFAPDTAYEEARKHLPEILTKRGVAPQAALALLDSLAEVIQPVQRDTYESFEHAARMRLASRDLDDWPVLATALALGCPIWSG